MSPEVAVPWSDILFSLALRWFAVFVVLAVLQVALYVSGAIVSRLVAALDRESSSH